MKKNTTQKENIEKNVVENTTEITTNQEVIVDSNNEILEKEKDFSPLTKEEFEYLESELLKIKSYMPNELMTPFWGYKNRIQKTNESQPCSCKSSSGHWIRCINILRDFVTSVNNQ